jgi:iron(III) transport system ATP-binding protein
MTATSIRFHNVSKRYGASTAVDNISFTVGRGQLVTILGPSGCGKTTTLRMIAGLEMPSSGQIFLGDTDVSRLPASERDVSMVFQSYALFPHMTVLENVAYGPRVQGTAVREAAARAEAALATVGLANMGARLPSELSGGQQQRVAVARALVLEPGVLLFDEPLSNLDAKLRRQMREEIRALQQRLSLTVVYVTHDQSEAMAVSDRIIVMNKAVIAEEGPPQALYDEPQTRFVASFMGEANAVSGSLTRRSETHADVQIGDQVLRLAHRGHANGSVNLAVRPEAMALVLLDREDGTPQGTPSPEAIATRGVVASAAFLGNLIEYTVETPLGTLFLVSPPTTRSAPLGADVAIAFKPHGVIVLRD